MQGRVGLDYLGVVDEDGNALAREVRDEILVPGFGIRDGGLEGLGLSCEIWGLGIWV